MRLVIKKDSKITGEECNELQRQISDIYYENVSITPEYFVEEYDYTTYPTYVDSDGDTRPTDSFLKGICQDVYRRYGEWGTDHVIVLVHEDNWRSARPGQRGIWGTSYSNIWHSYHVQYVRFDRDNMANSSGTFYHELMHSHDNLILTTLGIEIDSLFRVEVDDVGNYIPGGLQVLVDGQWVQWSNI